MPTRMNDAAGSEDQGAGTATDLGADLSPSEDALRDIARVDEVSLAAARDLVGTRLGHFRILSVLGRGGMGVVYRAQDETLRREVALKVLPPSVAESEERRRRFLREARAAAALSHPNIAVVHEVGETGEHIYIAMELIQGQSLAALLAGRAATLPVELQRCRSSCNVAGRRLPAGEALRLAREILAGLARAHAAGIVHRDLKPDNVMIAADGQVKLLDFGIAKVMSEDHSLPSGSASTAITQEGGFLGTPRYMSPEQAKGLAVDARSDVFSFGVTLYEMLTGERPFAGSTLMELLIAIDRDEPAAPSSKNPLVSAALEAIVLRCLRKDPAARYANAGELLREIEQLKGPAAASGLRRSGILGGVAMLVVFSVVVWGVLRGRTTPQDPAPAGSASTAPAPPIPTAVTDLPVPSSANVQAVADYRRGLMKLRTGEGAAWVEFQCAVDHDPTLGAAYVQLIAWIVVPSPESREHARKAQEFRASLTERDSALLDAMDPVVRGEPPDWAETTRRLTKLLERWPGDAQIWYLRGRLHNSLDYEAAGRYAMRAIELDPGYSMAYTTLAHSEFQRGRFVEGRRALERCLEIIPTSGACMDKLAALASRDGDCKRMESLARRIITADPQSTGAHILLANALAAQGQPIATVREAVWQWETAAGEQLPASTIAGPLFMPRALAIYAMQLDIFSGDFLSAVRHARELRQAVAASRQQSDHSWASVALSRILLETGQDKEAARVAVEFLERRHAWEPHVFADPNVPILLLVAMRGGAITRGKLIAHRDAWLRDASTRIAPVDHRYIWIQGYAATVDGPDAAREAMAALPKYEPLPFYGTNTMEEASVGRTFLLAGRVDDAVAWLQRVTRRCHVLGAHFQQTQAYLWLGQALEQKGDKPGACDAYRAVLNRWGQAKPRSVTAEEARRRVQAIGCER